jgi:hypothetical protein
MAECAAREYGAVQRLGSVTLHCAGRRAVWRAVYGSESRADEMSVNAGRGWDEAREMGWSDRSGASVSTGRVKNE